jgi:lysophospholipase L1-like esterase
MKFFKFIIAATLLIVLALSFYLYDRFSFTNEEHYTSIPKNRDSVLTIGIIGDSWAFGGELDSILSKSLETRGLNVQVISSGHPGSKSKAIYKNMFADSGELNSSRFVLEANPEYCIVLAGVNDATGQLGPDFYAHHMTLIIKALKHYNIKPVILELPEFGIVEYINQEGFIGNRYKAFAKFTNAGEIDNIKTYRAALNSRLKSENLRNDILFIDFDPICEDFNNCRTLFADFAHLSTEGKKLLSQRIINELDKDLNTRK